MVLMVAHEAVRSTMRKLETKKFEKEAYRWIL